MINNQKINTAIIIDDNKIAHWSLLSLVRAKKYLCVKVILNCTNTVIRKRIFKNFFYYLINIIWIKNFFNRKIYFNLQEVINNEVETVDFFSEYKGIWQKLPTEIVQKLKDNDIDLIVKFGMNLLTIPDDLPIKYGILSYHHGDPAKYRGRPAGFYEILNNENYLGVIVQRLSNKLDRGEILAFLESKIYLHSYRNTLIKAYKNSEFLLEKAIRNIISGAIPNHSHGGKIYKLPSNLIVITFVFHIFKKTLNRYLYGAFIEKKWQVGIIKNADFNRMEEIDFEKKEILIGIDKNYIFYADPFWYSESSILVEGLSKKTLKGEIIQIDRNKTEKILHHPKKHYSYPCIISQNDFVFLMPEMTSIGPQKIYKLSDNGISKSIKLAGFEEQRIVDPTSFTYNGMHYIFGGMPGNALSCLYLWYSKEGLFGDYHSHPMNPIVISPRGARMAGKLIKSDGKIVRLGQDNGLDYGNGIVVFEILEISESNYNEKQIGYIKFKGRKGPHTLNIYKGNILYDSYVDKFSLLAGIRRIIRTIA